MGACGYVDDGTTNAIVAERLAATDCRKRGLFAEVEGLGSVGAVSARILQALTNSGC